MQRAHCQPPSLHAVRKGAERVHSSVKEFRGEVKPFNRGTVTGEKVANVHTSGTFQSWTRVSLWYPSEYALLLWMCVCAIIPWIASARTPWLKGREGRVVCKAMMWTKPKHSPCQVLHSSWNINSDTAQLQLVLQAAALPTSQTWSNGQGETFSLPVWLSGKQGIPIWDLRMFLYLVRIPLWRSFLFLF